MQPKTGGNPALSGFPNVRRSVLRPEFGSAFVAGDLGSDLVQVQNALGLSDSVLTMRSQTQDRLGVTVERYHQQRNGLPVVAGDVHLTRGPNGVIRSIVGTTWKPGPVGMNVGTNAGTNASTDEDTARAVVAAQASGQVEVSDGELVYLAPSSGDSPILSWRFNVEGKNEGIPVKEDVFVDAELGEIAGRHSSIHSSLNRSTYDAQSSEYSEDFEFVRGEGDSKVYDDDIDTAHGMAGTVYTCFDRLFGRDSFDEYGAKIQSVAHYGEGVENAFWDGAGLHYGDGMATPDVIVHEFTHAVTDNSADLVYENESGALNEAMSDIFSSICQAAMSDSSTSRIWTQGDEQPEEFRRFLSDPTLDGSSSDYYPERYLGDEDHGGVHWNSGIANLAFYLLSEGGTHPRGSTRVYVRPIGIEDAGQIFYRALTTYMSANTDFLMARAATEQAAEDLFGMGSNQSHSVSEAWAAVGVGSVPAGSDTGLGLDEDNDPWNEPVPDTDAPPTVGGVEGSQPSTGGCNAAGQGTSPSWIGLLLLALMLRRRKESQSS